MSSTQICKFLDPVYLYGDRKLCLSGFCGKAHPLRRNNIFLVARIVYHANIVSQSIKTKDSLELTIDRKRTIDNILISFDQQVYIVCSLADTWQDKTWHNRTKQCNTVSNVCVSMIMNLTYMYVYIHIKSSSKLRFHLFPTLHPPKKNCITIILKVP